MAKAKLAPCDRPKIVLMADAAVVNLAVDKGGRLRVNWGHSRAPWWCFQVRF